MSSGSPGIGSSPAMRRGRCRSPGVHSKLSTSVTPGTRCLVFLRRCLAIQLQKVGLFPNTSTISCISSCENHSERDVPLYWMYDSGYLIFQGFLEANLKCFWNGALIEAMKVLEFQGYIAPGVLLVSGTACALEVVRAAWARNVLKPPNNYIITVVGDVEDCLVEPIGQGQFTPLPEALCWIILDMTASGQAAVMESICSTLEVAFPDMQKPSKQLVYDTLAKLTAEKKLYQTSNGYFVMTPDKLRLSGIANGVTNTSKKDYHIETYAQKPLLLTPEEAVVKMHGEMETVRDGNVTHQAIQTNLADVICGGNPNDKILYPRVSSKMRSGYSAERLERRHSLRFFGHGRRRSQSLQRTGSFKHIDKNDRLQNCAKESPATSEDMARKHTSLFSRLFRRSGRMRRDDSPSPISRPTFSAQFPPAEWFNKGVTHLHSVGTQTTYLAPSTDTLPKRSFNEYDFDEDISLNQDIVHKRHLSAFGTPRTIRRTSHSATLPRRSLAKKSSLYNVSSDKDASISRISSQTSVAPNTSVNGDTCDTPRTSSHSSIASSAKTVITNNSGGGGGVKETHGKSCASPTHKSLSSASSGYNSLPRSDYGSVRNSRLNRSTSKKTQQAKKSSTTTTESTTSSSKVPESSSITFHVSSKSSSDGCSAGSNKNETNATTMTTTINSGNKTKIFLQQHNTPTRSLITFENSTVDKRNSENDAAHDIIIVNQPPYSSSNNNNNEHYDAKLKPVRPTSLYAEQHQHQHQQPQHQQQHNNLLKSNKQTTRILESQLRMKYPSTETIQLEEKSLESISKDKRVNNEKCNVLHDLDSCKVQSTKNLYGFSSETELNNTKNTLLTLQNANVSLDKINNLKNNNLLNDDDKNKYHRDTINSEPASPVNCEFRNNKFVDNDLINTNKMSNNEIRLEKDLDSLSLEDSKLRHFADFPSLSDLSLRFTSLAAQNILRGVSFNSVDTLVEVNMAAEKKRNCDLNISTDLGVV